MRMTWKEAEEYLQARLPEYVERVTKKSQGKQYVCPICNSGQKENKSGAFSLQEEKGHWRWKCFSCDRQGDIFDLIGILEGVSTMPEQVKRAAEIFGVELESDGGGKASTFLKPIKKNEEPETDYREFFLQANKDLDKTAYHRGISKATLDRFQVGYVESWRHPKAPNSPASPRLIIPTSNYSYIARETRKPEEIPPEDAAFFEKYVGYKSKVGSVHFFNPEALQTATKPIFIVEGEIDALSVIDAGGEAIGLGATGMATAFLDYLKGHKPKQPLILALDNDKQPKEGEELTAAQKATKTLEDGLKAQGIFYYKADVASLYWDHKDANEALQADNDGWSFRKAIEATESAATDAEKKKREEANEEYLKTSVGGQMDAFLADLDNDNPPMATGIESLDKILDGGLYEGVTVLGGLSSVGKTSLALQIADNIASNGGDVLYFSLDMPARMLMAKGISRETLKVALEKKNQSLAKTARGVLTAGRLLESFSVEEKVTLSEANGRYFNSKHGGHIWIIDGTIGETITGISVDDIKERVEKHLLFTGNHPTVFIDFLQTLTPVKEDERASDKQIADHNMTMLKRIAGSLKVPIVALSSFNRSSYSKDVGMDAFKESGGIEYSADVLLALQLKKQGEKDFDEEKARMGENGIRAVELKTLKQRLAAPAGRIELNYMPLFDYFYEEKEI